VNVTFLYYVKFYNKDLQLYKIGVSSDVIQRVNEIKPEGFKILLLMMEDFPNRNDAFLAESLIKRLFEKDLARESFGLPKTETFNRDILNKDLKSEFVMVYTVSGGMVKVPRKDVDFD